MGGCEAICVEHRHDVSCWYLWCMESDAPESLKNTAGELVHDLTFDGTLGETCNPEIESYLCKNMVSENEVPWSVLEQLPPWSYFDAHRNAFRVLRLVVHGPVKRPEPGQTMGGSAAPL